MSSNNDILLKITDKFEEAIHAALTRSNTDQIFYIFEADELDKYDGSEEDDSSQEQSIDQMKKEKLVESHVAKLLSKAEAANDLDELLLGI